MLTKGQTDKQTNTQTNTAAVELVTTNITGTVLDY